ncbi:hypothetical protein TNCV_2547941 [Trichonephila clavipes]|nr:hypothetical protein TNCV_2547941 [Trichonephila clavipes]
MSAKVSCYLKSSKVRKEVDRRQAVTEVRVIIMEAIRVSQFTIDRRVYRMCAINANETLHSQITRLECIKNSQRTLPVRSTVYEKNTVNDE